VSLNKLVNCNNGYHINIFLLRSQAAILIQKNWRRFAARRHLATSLMDLLTRSEQIDRIKVLRGFHDHGLKGGPSADGKRANL